MTEKANRKDRKENQNIQVFVRLRPLNQREKDIKSLGVVEVVNAREVVVRQSHQTLHTKKFTFDRAFPPHSKQVEVYQEVVSPLIEEVLAGYNCTVFAYGQTGTGKTHTMVGEAAADETTWQNDPLAGIIPRALSQLFDELRISNTEYTVRVSYLELYNEELFDLLSGSDDNSKLRIYEDVTRKGSNIVNGLEEITVYNKNEVYKIMAQGQERKKVASTLMNAQSSRSHTVFTIVVHMKENSPEGEELVKIGKLNLVDLAGSENISKAGSDNPAKRERARECVNINQSLLTLGRVITALVERHPHIPYRESKLTRILQESLGGRTKTSIIATVSPGHKDVEETLSTLEYASRAKNIQNKPEINQKMTKKAILKEYAEEIDKLKKDLQAARDKNGIYLANETFAEMTFKQEEQRKEIQELLLKGRALEEERARVEGLFQDLGARLRDAQGQLTSAHHRLADTEHKLNNTTSRLQLTARECDEQRHLAEYARAKERALRADAARLLAAADAAARDALRLHDACDKRRQVESRNLETTRTYREVAARARAELAAAADHLAGDLGAAIDDTRADLETYTNDTLQLHSENKEELEALIKSTVETIEIMTKVKDDTSCSVERALQEQGEVLARVVRGSQRGLREALGAGAAATGACLQRAAAADLAAQLTALLDTWVSSARGQLSAARDTHGALYARAAGAVRGHAATARRSRDHAAERAQARARRLQNVLRIINEDKEQNDKMLADNLATIELERENKEKSLQQWIEYKKRALEQEIEYKKRALEQEIEERLKTERDESEERIKRNRQSIEEQKKTYEEKTARNIEWLTEILTEDEREMEGVEEELRESEDQAQGCIRDLDALTGKYVQENAAVSSSVDSLSAEVLGVTETLKSQLVSELEECEREVKARAEALVAEGERAADELEAGGRAALGVATAACRTALQRLLDDVDRQWSSATAALGAAAGRGARAATGAEGHARTQSERLRAARDRLGQHREHLTRQLQGLDELEQRCLQDDYTVYQPTGSTPARTRYEYPRNLTAASPQQRVLQRYRASRPATEDDCVVVVEDEEAGEGESESSTSDESGEGPATPSPPAAPLTPAHNAIVKCTSETDLYLRRRQQEQGKENGDVNRSMSFKKPSKLPAPSTAKKPLVERNAL